MTKEEFRSLTKLLDISTDPTGYIVIPIYANLDPEEVFQAEVTTFRKDVVVVTPKPPRIALPKPAYYIRPIAPKE